MCHTGLESRNPIVTGCTHLASWNSKQFNSKISMKASSVNARQGLSNLIAGKPDYILRQEDLD